KRRNQNSIWNRDPDDHGGDRRKSYGVRRGKGSLRGQAHRGHSFRQFDQTRPACRVRAEWCRAVLDRGTAEDEERRKGAGRVPILDGVWRAWFSTGYTPRCNAQLRGGANRFTQTIRLMLEVVFTCCQVVP